MKKATNALMSSTSCERLRPEISPEALCVLGGGKIAYVRKVTGKQAREEYPGAPDFGDEAILYSLHGADGTPMLLTDSREAAVSNAWQQYLEAVSVH